MEVTSGRIIPAWIDFDADKISGTITALPKREDIDFDIKEHLIVELYSK
jgi:small subunit ribosomal protein S4